MYVLIDHHRWPALSVVVAATAIIDWLYLLPRSWTLPAKFLIPGTVFLIGFQIIPIVYTINVAFSNYSTGHILTKQQAISTIKINSLEPPANGRQFDLAPARDSSGTLVLLLHDETSGKVYVGTHKGLTELPKSGVTLTSTGQPASAKGYTVIKGAELFTLDQQLRTFDVPTTDDAAIEPQGTSIAVELKPTLRYEPKHNDFVRISDGKVFYDNGLGSFVAGSGPNAEELEPGWKTYTGFRNFGRMLHDPLVRKPFFSIFAWTFAFAASCVFFSFAFGLFLAIALDKKGMRGQRLYRTVLVIPYAIPGFLSLLVWAGLLNDDFGVVNRLFHMHVPWLFGGNVFSWLPVHLVAAHRSRARQRVADDAVLLPCFARGAAVDPRRADRGGARRRRRRLADLPARDAPAAARRSGAADDRVVCVQLQQLQQRVPADPGRPL